MYTFSPMMVANSRKHHCRVRPYTREVLVISTNLDKQKNHYPLDFRNRRGDEARIKNTVDVRTYLLGGAIDSSEANGIIRDPKLELENSRFTFDLVPLSYESVDVVVGENWLLRHKAEMVCHEKVVKMPWLRSDFACRLTHLIHILFTKVNEARGAKDTLGIVFWESCIKDLGYPDPFDIKGRILFERDSADPGHQNV
ncbi:putative reverse transcriptase domain-containing protein [Tanacetum coccineum]